MFCKYCGKASGERDVCSACEEKIKKFMENGGSEQVSQNTDTTNNTTTADNMDSGNKQGQGYNWYESQMPENVDERRKENVKQKGFFSLPRIISFIGIIIFALCCIMPMFEYSDYDGICLIDEPNGGLVFIIPLFMLLNTIFDKSISGISFSGAIPHRTHGFFRFRLCIVWGVIGVVTLLCLGSNYSGTPGLSRGLFYYLAFVGCGLTIIAPFFVRENDGTGIKPIKKWDYIWIVAVVVIACVLCSRLQFVDSSDTEQAYSSEDKKIGSNNKSNDNKTDNKTYYKDNTAISETESNVSESENNVSDSKSNVSEPEVDENAIYSSKLQEMIAQYPSGYCLYDVDKDGKEDFIVLSPNSGETDAGNQYRIYVYSDGVFNYIDSISTYGYIYGTNDYFIIYEGTQMAAYSLVVIQYDSSSKTLDEIYTLSCYDDDSYGLSCGDEYYNFTEDEYMEVYNSLSDSIEEVLSFN